MNHGWVLLTGATAGIGYELAKCFAARGFNLVVVARDAARLQGLAEELYRGRGVVVEVRPCDLTSLTERKALLRSLEGRPIDILVNNAGAGALTPFLDYSPEDSLRLMHLNMDAIIDLTHPIAREMVKRRQGRILNVASTAAFQPGPFMAVYYATKAFVVSFSAALREELRGTGVTVTTLCPGLTRTEFADRAGMRERMKGMPIMEASTVAEAAFRGLIKGKPMVIPGFLNRVTSAISRRLPMSFTARIVRAINGH